MGHRHSHRDHLGKRNPDSGDGGIHVVYVTMPADFEGEVGGYQTDGQSTTTQRLMGVGPAVQATRTSSSEQTTQMEEAKTETTQQETHMTNKQATKTEQTATQTLATDTGNAQTQTTLSTAISEGTKTAATNVNNNNQIAAATAGSSSSEQSSASPSTSAEPNSSAISGGAKAGIAIGVIAAVGLIAGLIFLFMRKKKKAEQQQEAEDEKVFGNHGAFPPVSPRTPESEQPRTPAEPPQLEVRPITQFAPFGGHSDVLTAVTAAGAAAGANAVASRGNQPPPDTPLTSTTTGPRDPFSDPVNPFQIRNEPPSPDGTASLHSLSVKSIPEAPETVPDATEAPGPAVATAAGGAVAATGVAAATDNKSEKELPAPPMAENAERSAPPAPDTASANAGRPLTPPEANPSSNAPTAAPVVAPAPGPLNVHRVQMDFGPSMDDELGLRVGQLVRLLHEYDDGWALCVRLDRSQQGVAPRSCLSAHPVKPRPRPPPGGPPGPRGPPVMGPNGRVMPSQSPRFYPQDGRPGSPARPMSPARSMSPAHPPPAGPPPPLPYPQRPMSPGQFSAPRSMPQRSMSPGPYGPPGLQRPQMPVNQRQRSNSASNAVGPGPRAGAEPSPLSAPLTSSPSGTQNVL
ncbi:SH3 domain protein [Aspergillus glaucus CBS 516.65]|uniref:SH3 domain-containing protein n=1 Tax=Aspergillus glaucus CBS 516.65 TaxID=1160497 RepID=A0A1L9VAC1_ASPGL|nr:hypothetical protein ASPGLDRAFT_50805 [Aspergillus glaucus CBS 516.65]OJJ80850.1 hypothetical protein ASPGLDRAFT_50805 [Aspergillus glaucus CBS 516.65]